MERSTNTLEELAERLDYLVRFVSIGVDYFHKAQRIVAELARVEYGDDGHIQSWTDTEIKLKKCREIAEEGEAK